MLPQRHRLSFHASLSFGGCGMTRVATLLTHSPPETVLHLRSPPSQTPLKMGLQVRQRLQSAAMRRWQQKSLERWTPVRTVMQRWQRQRLERWMPLTSLPPTPPQPKSPQLPPLPLPPPSQPPPSPTPTQNLVPSLLSLTLRSLLHGSATQTMPPTSNPPTTRPSIGGPISVTHSPSSVQFGYSTAALERARGRGTAWVQW
mmetsp:Transcript_10549/g.31133  ORF Transcript_10549/g.31133 Transcript_10549/m.31133 type:complete len:201 (-) Transcript_10549:277-879(-)